MNSSDATPRPSEVMLAGLLAELDQTPPSQRSVVLGRYLQEYPEHAGTIREMVDADAGVRPAPGADPSTRRLKPGQRLGPFRVVRFVAQGGMGEVYEAIQDVLDRRVALKVIRKGFVSPVARARFLRVQQVLAKLHQTNIVPVHHASEEGDLQYCAMQFVDGASLHKVVTELYRQETSLSVSRITPPIREVVDSLLRSVAEAPAEAITIGVVEPNPDRAAERPVSSCSKHMTLSPSYFDSGAAVMIQVAEAVQHGHEHNICHRDIKPSNLMIDSQEICWVIDYGLAGAVNSSIAPDPTECNAGDSRLTQGPLGTPQYMAPEQFEGKTDPRSDIWSLGVTLYELLTLQPAFRGEDWAATKELVAHTEPETPRGLVRNVPQDLAAICRKAMAKDPADRYASAQSFAEDLRCWTHWEPTKARPGWSTLRPLRLWAWRNKAWAAMAAVVLMGLVGGLIVSEEMATASETIAKERISAANAIADEKARQLVELQQEQARHKAVLESQRLQHGIRIAGWAHKAMAQIEAAKAIRSGEDLRDLAAGTFIGMDATQIYEHLLPMPPQRGHLGIGQIAFSPDGLRVLAAGWRTGNDLSPALLWDGNNGHKPAESTRPGAGPVAFPDADSPLQLILPVTSGQPMTLWNVGTNTKVLDISLPLPGEVGEAALSPDARFAAVSFAPVKVIGSLPEPVTMVWAIDRKAKTPTAKNVASWSGMANTLAFSPDGLLVATGSAAGEVVVRSTMDGKPAFPFKEGELPITALAFGRNFCRPGDRSTPPGLADTWLLAVGTKGGNLAVWDLRTRIRKNAFSGGNEHDIYALTFSPDGTTLASTGRNQAFMWNVANGRPILRVQNSKEQFPNLTNGAAFSQDGKRLAFAGPLFNNYGGLFVYQLDNDRGIRQYRGLTGVVEKTWLSPSGKWVAALTQSWQLGVWDRVTGRLQFIWSVPAGWFADNSAAAFDENDAKFVFASGERASKWDLVSGELTKSWTLPLGLNDCLVTRPGKRPILVRRDRADGFQTLRARELGPEREMPGLYRLDFEGAIVNTAISDDGHVLLVNVRSKDGHPRAHLFDGLTGKAIPLDPAVLPPNYRDGVLTATGKTIALDEPIADQVRSQVFRLPGLQRLAVHSAMDRCILRRIDDEGKLGLASGERAPDGGVALYRVGEARPLVTFDTGSPPIGNAFGISPDGLIVYWGRRDGTVCVADLNRCIAGLNPFEK